MNGNLPIWFRLPGQMEITVSCPKCNYQLHLPSRDFLGRKGKCPGCAHKFIMEEPKAEGPAHQAPKPGESRQPAKKQTPKTLPPKEPWDKGNATVYSTGQTQTDAPPAAAAGNADARSIQESGASGDIDDSSAGEITLDDARPAGLADDSALVPDDIWDEINEPAEKPKGEVRPPKDVVARCPHCHTGVDFRRDDDLRDFLCPQCDTPFSLIHPESPPEAVAMPERVGSYLIRKQPRIGIGPFGNVYRAKDGQSHQTVVIKVSRGDQVSAEEMPRFLATLQSAMQLKHPNIASLKEMDEAGDRIYLVSNFVSGIDLSEYLTETSGRKLTVREAASLCALVASVLHHAHKFGVVHGNLKPSNIRLDSNQKPFLMDFGLANRQNHLMLTGNGRIVGTAAYLAPEQLPGSRRAPDPQTDVFALGVIFYELLTGRRPFPGEGEKLLKQIAAGSPVPPRGLDSQVPKPLNTICMKCLEVDPHDRYQSAMELYKELRLYLEDKPIHTKPPGFFKRIARWFR